MTSPRRRKGGYFTAVDSAPSPIVIRLAQRIRFSDVDAMAVLWHGRYAKLFEHANEELGRLCGMSYPDFQRDRLIAPIVQLHVDYFSPVKLGEMVSIVGKMIWTDAARIDIEYQVLHEDQSLAAAGFTVQMFVDESGSPLMAAPAMLENCRKRWLAGEFKGNA